MFLHMGLYSHLGGQWKGKTYYGIGEWIKKLTYKGEGRPVWSVSTSEGVKIQNQQAANHVFKPYRTGIISFSKPGKHKVSVSLAEGDPIKSSLEAITFTPGRQQAGEAQSFSHYPTILLRKQRTIPPMQSPRCGKNRAS